MAWRHIAPAAISADDIAFTEQLADQARRIAPPDAEVLCT